LHVKRLQHFWIGEIQNLILFNLNFVDQPLAGWKVRWLDTAGPQAFSNFGNRSFCFNG
jgi:hypothetical protein